MQNRTSGEDEPYFSLELHVIPRNMMLKQHQATLGPLCIMVTLIFPRFRILVWICVSERMFVFTLVLLFHSRSLCYLSLFSCSGERDPGNSQVPASQKLLSAHGLQWNKDCLSVGMLMGNPTQTVMATVWQLGTKRENGGQDVSAEDFYILVFSVQTRTNLG